MDPRTKVARKYRSRAQERMIATRSTWSSYERRQRAEWAHQKQERLWSAIDAYAEDDNVWAVGAVSATDIMRLRGE